MDGGRREFPRPPTSYDRRSTSSLVYSRAHAARRNRRVCRTSASPPSSTPSRGPARRRPRTTRSARSSRTSASSPCRTRGSSRSRRSRRRRRSFRRRSSSWTSPASSAARRKGEGLGNKFLQHIREVDAIVQVVRCFEDRDIVHVSGALDPLSDIETVTTELVLADLETVTKARDKAERIARGGDKEARATVAAADRLLPHLNAGKPAITLAARRTDEKAAVARPLSPDLQADALRRERRRGRPRARGRRCRTSSRSGSTRRPTWAPRRSWSPRRSRPSSPSCRRRTRASTSRRLGVAESGVGALIRAAYHLLGLRTYFTAGEKEARAWTIHAGTRRPRPRASSTPTSRTASSRRRRSPTTTSSPAGSMAAAREKGLVRQEGRDYVVAGRRRDAVQVQRLRDRWKEAWKASAFPSRLEESAFRHHVSGKEALAA